MEMLYLVFSVKRGSIQTPDDASGCSGCWKAIGRRPMFGVAIATFAAAAVLPMPALKEFDPQLICNPTSPMEVHYV
jgi:hypothetical protein